MSVEMLGGYDSNRLKEKFGVAAEQVQPHIQAVWQGSDDQLQKRARTTCGVPRCGVARTAAAAADRDDRAVLCRRAASARHSLRRSI